MRPVSEFTFLNSTSIIHIKFQRAVRPWGAAGVFAQAVGTSEQPTAIYSCNEPTLAYVRPRREGTCAHAHCDRRIVF